MIGLEKGTVRLDPYTDEWERIFKEEAARLQAALGSDILDIQHVGSTSIPGMTAKPIIDIAIAVRNIKDASVCIAPVEELGYEYKGENGIPGRLFFAKGSPRTHHIHINEMGSRGWQNQILFRDYLILHPDFAREYAHLKLELAQRYPTDRQSYLDCKAPFIERVLRLASSEE